MFDNIDTSKLLESILNPLGGLNLSDSERKLLFFRHVGAEYAMSARKNRVPYASNITRAGTQFGGLGGGTDPMMLLMLSGAFTNDKDDPKLKEASEQVTEELDMLMNAFDGLLKRVDKIAKKVGVGA